MSALDVPFEPEDSGLEFMVSSMVPSILQKHMQAQQVKVLEQEADAYFLETLLQAKGICKLIASACGKRAATDWLLAPTNQHPCIRCVC